MYRRRRFSFRGRGLILVLVECSSSIDQRCNVGYASNLPIYLYTLLEVILVHHHYYISNLYIPMPWAQAGSKLSFSNMLLKRSRYASLFIPFVELR